MCRSPDRTLIRAHRLAFCFDTGREPDPELDVCHFCDRRICVRPSHLFEGTAKDNIQDCIKKGRFKGYDNLLIGQKRTRPLPSSSATQADQVPHSG